MLGSRASRSAGGRVRSEGTPDAAAAPEPTGAAAAGAGAEAGPSNRAMEVIDRIQKKLIGQDFGSEILDAKSQVGRLIEEATSETNLAMLFHGWCR